MKNTLIDLRDFGSAAIRFAVFVPLYKVVVTAERKNVHLPFSIVNAALHGQRRARGDWQEIKGYYFG